MPFANDFHSWPLHLLPNRLTRDPKSLFTVAYALFYMSCHGCVIIPISTYVVFNIASNRVTTALLANQKLNLILFLDSCLWLYSFKVRWCHLHGLVLALSWHTSSLIPVLWTLEGYTMVGASILKKSPIIELFCTEYTLIVAIHELWPMLWHVWRQHHFDLLPISPPLQ